MIGLGNGLFAVGMLTAAMVFGGDKMAGLTLGAWGAVQAAAAGVAMFSEVQFVTWSRVGRMRDCWVSHCKTPASGYGAVYHRDCLAVRGARGNGSAGRQPGEAGGNGKRLELSGFSS